MNQSFHPARRRAVEDSNFAGSVVEGLSRAQKSIPCRFLYDARGSALFEEITGLPEYYPTRCELEILEARAEEISARHDSATTLVEFGSGYCRKTELLIERLGGLSLYAPMDISEDALMQAQRRLEKKFPHLRVTPVIGDFTQEIVLPEEAVLAPKLGFFPGSTIGNFTPCEAVGLLGAMRRSLSPEGAMIIGVDLKKDPGVMLRAYDDASGVTAAFNLNLLARINRELQGNFDLLGFRHEAVYNEDEGRMEMRLVSLRDQLAIAAGKCFRFIPGERIHTENSYKYEVSDFQRMAGRAGWRPGRVWKDSLNNFSLHELLA
jgi:dimethylhistidine N-methyltransferase